MGSFVNLLFPIGLGALMIALMIIPENKRRKKYQSMLDNLKINDRVVTRGGMVAKIISMNEDKNEVVLETVPDKVRMTFLKILLLILLVSQLKNLLLKVNRIKAKINKEIILGFCFYKGLFNLKLFCLLCYNFDEFIN